MFSCGCQTACACIQNCQCKNAGLKWINMCSGWVGEPAIIVILMMMSFEHNRFLYYMHEMYQLCWTLTVYPNLISISSPSRIYRGVAVITITLNYYYVYMLNCYDRDSHRMAEAWSDRFGYGIHSNWYGQLKYVHFISMHLITIWLMKWLSLIPGMAIWCS